MAAVINFSFPFPVLCYIGVSLRKPTFKDSFSAISFQQSAFRDVARLIPSTVFPAESIEFRGFAMPTVERRELSWFRKSRFFHNRGISQEFSF
jgi:hypothetical protein